MAQPKNIMELLILKILSWLFIAGAITIAVSAVVSTLLKIPFKKVFSVTLSATILISAPFIFTGCKKQDPYPPLREIEVSVDCTDCEWKLLKNDSTVASNTAIGSTLTDSILYQQVIIGDHFKLLVWTDDTIKYQRLYYLGKHTGKHPQQEDDYWFSECTVTY